MDYLSGESEVFTMTPGARPEVFAGALPQVMKGISYRKFPNDGLNALQLELEDFIGAVENGSKPRVTGQDGRAALEVAIKIMENMEVSARSVE